MSQAPMPQAIFDVSVVVPLYNKAGYVARALGSALTQSTPVREIIVVDDGSSDGGAKIVAGLAQRSSAVRLVRQANAGPSAARNRGIAEASGAWVAFLDADDVWLPGHLARLSQMAAAHPDAGLLASGYRDVREGSHAAAGAAWSGGGPEGPSERIDDFYQRWCRGVFFFTTSVAIQRAALLALGEAFPRGERLGEDHDVWFRIIERVPMAWTPSIGALFTVGLAESLTGSLAVTEPLPAYRRLAARLAQPGFPEAQRNGARRLVATHWLNVARARAPAGDAFGARQLVANSIGRQRPLYWLRTLLVLTANMGPWRLLHLGRI